MFRGFYLALVFMALLFLTGCENPIQGVGLTMNPDGTFGVNVVLKGGQVIQFDHVTPGRMVALQKQYRIPSSMLRVSDGVVCDTRGRVLYDPRDGVDRARAVVLADTPEIHRALECPDCRTALTRSFAELQAVQARELNICEVADVRAIRSAITPTVEVKPSMRERVRNVVMFRSPHYVRTITNGGDTPVSRLMRWDCNQCQCPVNASVSTIPDTPVYVEPQLPPVVTTPPPNATAPPNVSELQPGFIPPPSATEKAVSSLEGRVGSLESDVKKILTLLEKK